MGYTATDQNIKYLDLDSGIVKTSHHAQFDEAWYLQPSRPPAAQLLYDLGLETEDAANPPFSETASACSTPSWPPLLPKHNLPPIPPLCRTLPLPLRETGIHRPIAAAAAQTTIATTTPAIDLNPQYPPAASRIRTTNPSDIVSEYLIGQRDMSTFYMSPDPYFEAFDEVLDLRKFDLSKHRTAGLCLLHSDDRLYLGGMSPGTPGAKIPRWCSRLKGAWLIKVGDTIVTTIQEAQLAFAQESTSNPGHVSLLFLHPEVRLDISYDGLPIMSSAPFSQHIHDQINKRWDFSTVAEYLRKAPPYNIVGDGNVLNYTTKVIKLTRGKLMKQQDWTDWQSLEYLQLNQYEDQGMFGSPVAVSEDDAIFHLVWTYNVKAVVLRVQLWHVYCHCD